MVRSQGGIHVLVADPTPLLAQVPADTNLLGMGAGGVMVGAACAALLQADFAFYRRTRKDHGTQRHLEGTHVPSRGWTVFHCDTDDLDELTSAGFEIAHAVRVRREETPLDDVEPAKLTTRLPVAEASVDFGAAVEVLTGGTFVRSSGEVAQYYFETLKPAHMHNVAAGFAHMISEHRSDAIAGVMWGGCYLAAVAAAASGAGLLFVDPDAAAPDARLPGAISSAGFVDDLINTGTDFRLCERIAAANNVSPAFHALYSVHLRAHLEHHEVVIGHRLVR